MSKISELSDGGVIQGGDTLIAVRSGGNVKVTYGGSTTANIDGGTIDGTTIGGTTPAAGNFTTGSFTGDVSFGDNDKAVFGAGSDLQIYHSGSASIIGDFGTGDLLVRGENLKLQNTAGENYLVATNNDATRLYHDSAEKLATTSTGIDVTGTVTADGLTVDGTVDINLGSDGSNIASLSGASAGRKLDIQSFAVGASTGAGYSINATSGQGQLDFQTTGNSRLNIDAGGDISFYEDTGTTAKLFWDASAESLGIGTSTVTNGKLVIEESGTSVGSTIRLIGTNSSAGASQVSHITSYQPSGGSAQDAALDFKVRGAADAYASPSTVMTLLGDGNVGIGTDSPDRTLSVKGASGVNIPLTVESGTGQSNCLIAIRDPSTTSPYAVAIGADTDDMLFRAGGSERMRLDSSGSVAINSDGSVASLDGVAGLQIGNSSASNAGIALENSSRGYLMYANGSSLSFWDSTVNSDRITLDSSGNLLVGTTDTTIFNDDANEYGFMVEPSGQMQLSANNATMLYLNRQNGDGTIVDFRKDGSTVGSIATNSSRFELDGSGNPVRMKAGTSNIQVNNNTHISFDTAGGEAARFDSSGNLLVGDTSSNGGGRIEALAANNANPAIVARSDSASDESNRVLLCSKFTTANTTSQVFVQFAINNNATASGQINANGANQVAFGSWSDYRLKENITDLPSQLANITALRPVEFDYIESEGGAHQLGFVAQEVEEIYPDLVGERNDGMKTLAGLGKWEARLVKAIQEQNEIINDLRARVAQLETN